MANSVIMDGLDKTSTNPTNNNTMTFSQETKSFVMGLNEDFIPTFWEFYLEGYERELELVQDEVLDWMKQEDDDFSELVEQWEEDDADEWEELKEDISAALGWSQVQDWMNENQKRMVEANKDNRGTREAWRLWDEVFEAWLEESSVGPELVDAADGLPDAMKDWTDETRKVEQDRLEARELLQAWLFAWSPNGCGWKEGFLEKGAVQEGRLANLKALVEMG